MEKKAQSKFNNLRYIFQSAEKQKDMKKIQNK